MPDQKKRQDVRPDGAGPPGGSRAGAPRTTTQRGAAPHTGAARPAPPRPGAERSGPRRPGATHGGGRAEGGVRDAGPPGTAPEEADTPGTAEEAEVDAARRRRRAQFLRELNEAKELRDRVQPRRARAARMRQAMRMRTFRW